MALRIGLRKKTTIAAATAPITDPTPPVKATPPRTTAATLLRVALAPMLKRGSPLPVMATVASPAMAASAPPMA